MQLALAGDERSAKLEFYCQFRCVLLFLSFCTYGYTDDSALTSDIQCFFFLNITGSFFFVFFPSSSHFNISTKRKKI
jgi:hypothetical protein